jgi:hypothetical protein
MSLPYISPAKMTEYRQAIGLFAKGSPSVECVSSHYLPDATGVCALTGAKEQEEIFVLKNRVGSTLKVSAQAMQIVANVVDITGADHWYQHLKEQRRANRERVAEESKRKEEAKKSSRVVLFKRSPAAPFSDNKNS